MTSERRGMLRPAKPQHPYSFLLGALGLVLVWPMIFEPLFAPGREFPFALLVLAGIWAVHRARVILGVTVLLGLVAIVSLWAQSTLDVSHAIEVRALSAALFDAVVCVAILRHITRMEHVTFDTICGSLCVYLLMGMMFAHLQLLVQVVQLELDPFGIGVTSLEAAQVRDNVNELMTTFVYFSFVTLTTLGYGDIAPTTNLARGVCMFEAIVGQIYLVVMVSGLVGLHLSSRSRRLVEPSTPENE